MNGQTFFAGSSTSGSTYVWAWGYIKHTYRESKNFCLFSWLFLVLLLVSNLLLLFLQPEGIILLHSYMLNLATDKHRHVFINPEIIAHRDVCVVSVCSRKHDLSISFHVTQDQCADLRNNTGFVDIIILTSRYRSKI